MLTGYYKPQLMLPAPLPTQEQNPVTPLPTLQQPSYMSQAQGMAAGSTNGIYAQPTNQGSLTQLAYRLAGPAPQPPARPVMTGQGLPTLPMMDPSTILKSGSGTSPASVLGTINQGRSLYQQGQNLSGLVGGGLSGVGSGAAANGALADAGFTGSVPAVDLGTAGAGLSAVGGAGTGALDAASFSQFSPSASAAIDSAAGSTGALAGSGLSTALPLAAIGWAAADAINKSVGVGEKGRLSGAWASQVGGTPTFYGKLQTGYTLPDGTHVSNLQAQALSSAWKNGDSEEYARLITELKAS